MSFLVLVVDDEPDVEILFLQQFRRELRDKRFRMDFAIRRVGWDVPAEPKYTFQMRKQHLDTFPVARSLHRILWRWRIGAVSTAHTKFGANEQFATGVASVKVLSGRP